MKKPMSMKKERTYKSRLWPLRKFKKGRHETPGRQGFQRLIAELTHHWPIPPEEKAMVIYIAERIWATGECVNSADEIFDDLFGDTNSKHRREAKRTMHKAIGNLLRRGLIKRTSLCECKFEPEDYEDWNAMECRYTHPRRYTIMNRPLAGLISPKTENSPESELLKGASSAKGLYSAP
jgi:hypothetical protein